MGRRKKIFEPKNGESTSPNQDIKVEEKNDLTGAENVINNYLDEKAVEEKKERKKRISKEDEKQANDFSQMAVITAHVGLQILVDRLPKKIPLSEEEKNSFNLAFTNLAKKYFPAVQRFGEEVTFIASLGFIFLARMDFDKPKEMEPTIPTLVKEDNQI